MKQSMHKRKNSLSASLNLNQGRRSPQSLIHSPQGRKSPNFLTHDQMRSPDRRSPTSGSRRSPVSGFYQPSHTPTEKLSPSGHPYTSERRSPTNYNITSPILPIADRKSPIGPIPPITISNPSETYPIIHKTMPSQPEKPSTSPKSPSPARESPSPNAAAATPNPEKKEKPSVMKEILNFVRKPSKKVTTHTSKFAAAFTRRESGSGSPLMRQSTFSSIPNTSSRAGRNAITKQISEVGFEPKMSLKLKSVGSKMSLRLRRFEDRHKDKEKKSSGDEISAGETSDSGKVESVVNDSPEIFEMDKVKFEKVGESYRHDHISEEGPSSKPGSEEIETETNNLQAKIEHVYEELKKSLGTIMDKTNAGLEGAVGGQEKTGNTIQCEIQIEPPSRRASFDPPRSPYLENLRSLSSTDHSRVDSGGESFELVDSDRYRESSFEDRCSSISSSFNISRYQSTSYEDPTSSFEIVEGTSEAGGAARQEGKKSPYDARKSSIELVDAETFARSSPKGRKSSLETHFDLADNYKVSSTSKTHCGPKQLPCGKDVKKQYQHHRTRSPLSYQTSSNYSSRDSYDSNMDPMNHTRQHYVVQKSPNGPNAALLCTDKRCAQIFEPRPTRTQSPFLGPQDTSSGSEFEPPSPRRAASASPKHTFTFRIVLKKVESSPDDICPTSERRSRDSRHRRRDSRKKRLFETGKSF